MKSVISIVVAVLLILVVLVSISTVARADNYAFLDRLEEYQSTRESRLGAAENFLHDVNSIDDSVPNLRPDIEEWVVSELDRLRRKHGVLGQFAHPEAVEFRSTREFLVHSVKKSFSEQREAIHCIRNRPDIELTCWSELGRSFSGPYQADLELLVTEYGVVLPETRKYSGPVWMVYSIMESLAFAMESPAAGSDIAATRPVDYLDASFAARCSALHVALSARQHPDSKEASNNMFDATLFAAHKKIGDNQVLRFMPWANSYWESNALEAIVDLSFCTQVSELIGETWSKTFSD